MVYATERLVDTMLAMNVVFGGKSVEVVEYFKDSGLDYVQFQLRLLKHTAEIIAMDQSKCTLDEFPSKVLKDKAQYYLFRYRHTHENELLSSIGKNLVLYIFQLLQYTYCVCVHSFNAVFILTTPHHGAASKSGVMYAACKNAVMKELQNLGVEIDLKVIYLSHL